MDEACTRPCSERRAGSPVVRPYVRLLGRRGRGPRRHPRVCRCWIGAERSPGPLTPRTLASIVVQRVGDSNCVHLLDRLTIDQLAFTSARRVKQTLSTLLVAACVVVGTAARELPSFSLASSLLSERPCMRRNWTLALRNCDNRFAPRRGRRQYDPGLMPGRCIPRQSGADDCRERFVYIVPLCRVVDPGSPLEILE